MTLDDLKPLHGVVPLTLGADKGNDAGEFFCTVELCGVEPHVSFVRTPRDSAKVKDAADAKGDRQFDLATVLE